MKIIFQNLLISVILATLLPSVLKGMGGRVRLPSDPPPEAPRLTVSPSIIAPGEHVTLSIRGSRSTPLLKIDDTLLRESEDLTVLSVNKKETAQDFLWTYEVTGYLPGDHTIPPLRLVLGPDSYSTSQEKITVEKPSLGKEKRDAPLGLEEDLEYFHLPWYLTDLFWKGLRGIWSFILITLLYLVFKEKLPKITQGWLKAISPILRRKTEALACERFRENLSSLSRNMPGDLSPDKQREILSQLSNLVRNHYSLLSSRYLEASLPQEFSQSLLSFQKHACCRHLLPLHVKEIAHLLEVWDARRFSPLPPAQMQNDKKLHEDIALLRKISQCGR